MIIQTKTDIGGKVLVDDSLIMYLDASNPESYPGSGTTWYDLTKYGSNGTMDEALFVPGSPSYMHINNDGTGGNNLGVGFQVPLVIQPYLGPEQSVTVDMWVRVPSYGLSVMFGWWRYWFGFNTFPSANNQFGWGTGAGDFREVVDSTINSGIIFNNWINIIIVMKINVPYSNNKAYFNSVLQSNTTGNNITPGYFNPIPPEDDTSYNQGYGRIGSWRITGGVNDFPRSGTGINYPLNFYCSIVRIYNRELTQLEITQNFNALKSRFGIF